jgi:DNA polymerase-3 subunit epsilon
MKYVFFDTETTGLIGNSLIPIDKQPHIIELFMLKTDEKGKELERFHSLFSVNMKLPEKIKKITGISDEDLKEQPVFFEKIEQIDLFLKDADFIIAHNINFDIKMLEIEYFRAAFDFDLTGIKKICTVEQTEHLKGYRLKLNDLYHYLFDQNFKGAHRAQEDVIALAQCFFELKNRSIL